VEGGSVGEKRRVSVERGGVCAYGIWCGCDGGICGRKNRRDS
jgi:hypothetical protein